MGLKIVTWNCDTVSIWRKMIRNLFDIFWPFNFILMIQKNQKYGDILCGTMVILKENKIQKMLKKIKKKLEIPL